MKCWTLSAEMVFCVSYLGGVLAVAVVVPSPRPTVARSTLCPFRSSDYVQYRAQGAGLLVCRIPGSTSS